MLKIQIQRDMILLENQIPLFILARLLGLQLGNPDQEGRVGRLVLKFFNPIGSERVEFDASPGQCGLHCLEVLWQSFLPSGLTRARTTEWQLYQHELIPCLTELMEAGIKFREYITSYVMFMHNLINSSEDVRYLCKHGIIEHCLGSDAEVADLFNLLCQEMALDSKDSNLHNVSIMVNDYRKWKHFSLRTSWRASMAQKWNAWRAILENKPSMQSMATTSRVLDFLYGENI
ncbi:hypothetical protein EUGRSUZ_I00838 [Eucalyptus grandis]|uniref:Uncharacterized protein n=2 Tax=Eucalyptus grandis TaxID=71139 RepID=A0ACC3JD56_EUCGR|nr:hypothetical protein EUGRSUZ_I00838 [Eucalyptus grandis]